MPDPDKYYTPLQTARELLALATGVDQVEVVVDPSCGEGNLLHAAQERWPSLRLRGLDVDQAAVARIRRHRPGWDVAVGSVFPTLQGPRNWTTTFPCDLVLTNPPFSMENRKFVPVRFGGTSQRSSLAMAHILAAIQAFRPRVGLLAIMPESALFSELDQAARDCLGTTHRLVVGSAVPSSTFRGARARSVICAWINPAAYTVPRVLGRGPAVTQAQAPSTPVSIIRGNLPVFKAHPTEGGLRFLHSTALSGLRSDAGLPTAKVAPLGSSQVHGHAVLLPRVGAVRESGVIALKIRSPVQLSDCVIALSVISWADALSLRRLIMNDWETFAGLYRGTGAPFITLGRLRGFLVARGIAVSEVRQSATSGRAGFAQGVS